MATASRLRARFRPSVLVLSVTAAVAATVVPVGLQSAAASPHLSLSQVKARIAALNDRAERITESYNNARDQLQTVQRQEQVTQRTLDREKAALARVQATIAKSAAAAYRTGGLDSTLSLVTTGSPRTYLDQQAGLDQVARYQADQLAAADAAQRQVAAVEAVHNAQVAQAARTVHAIATQKAGVQQLLDQENQLLSRLKAADRRRLQAQQQAAQRHQVAMRSSYHAPSYHGAASGQAAAAVRFAYAQLGKPYVYGAAGPSSYDCSGLTMASWAAAGVSLPHNAAAQQASIPGVSLSALQPGDLIFFGSPAYHVAIYIGGGRMIQAPHTGASVEITPVSYMSPSGAGRP